MSKKEPQALRVVVAIFDQEDEASEALKKLKGNTTIDITQSAILKRDEEGKLSIKETDDMGGGKGAAVGGAIGFAIGAVAGPGAIATGALGAALGGIFAKVRDTGFHNSKLKEVGEALKANMSAVILMVDADDKSDTQHVLQAEGADIFTEMLDGDVVAKLIADAD